jgi:hypothetical protein
MLKPFLAIFEKFKYLTTATLTPKRNTVGGGCQKSGKIADIVLRSILKKRAPSLYYPDLLVLRWRSEG